MNDETRLGEAIKQTEIVKEGRPEDCNYLGDLNMALTGLRAAKAKLGDSATDPHAEPLLVTDTDGLRLPESYIGYDGGLVARMPNGGTVDSKPREWGAFHPLVRPRHFGEDGAGTNTHLNADEVGLKRYGEAEEVFRVVVEDA